MMLLIERSPSLSSRLHYKILSDERCNNAMDKRPLVIINPLLHDTIFDVNSTLFECFESVGWTLKQHFFCLIGLIKLLFIFDFLSLSLFFVTSLHHFKDFLIINCLFTCLHHFHFCCCGKI